MIQTARYLASIRGKTIVLTGSFKPETFKDSDAEFNVGMALGALQCMHSPGVYVVMSGKVFASDNVRRNEITGAFESKSWYNFAMVLKYGVYVYIMPLIDFLRRGLF